MASQLSRRTYTQPIKAKVGSRCPFCERRIKARVDFISEVKPNEKWGHYSCVKGYAETINEHLEEAA
jgi:hypothetical protein